MVPKFYNQPTLAQIRQSIWLNMAKGTVSGKPGKSHRAVSGYRKLQRQLQKKDKELKKKDKELKSYEKLKQQLEKKDKELKKKDKELKGYEKLKQHLEKEDKELRRLQKAGKDELRAAKEEPASASII
jgi:myosin heavy subunit